MRNIGRVKVSKQILEEAMHLPSWHHIVSVGALDENGSFEVVVEGPMMPEFPDSQVSPPEVMITIHDPGPPYWQKVERLG